MKTISDKAIAQIIEFEGIDQPDEWPGSQSGITIGRGYDLGYEENFTKDWSRWLSAYDLNRLSRVTGLKGQAAHRVAPTLTGVKIPLEGINQVFYQVTIPRYTEQTARGFPGSEQLNPDAFGALVMLVFNRGTDITDEPGSTRRIEMRHIHQILDSRLPEKQKLDLIADQLEAMCRIWPNVRGLRRRRMAEAKLVRESIDTFPGTL